VTKMSEVIEYRGEKIPVGWYREQYAGFKNEDGSPYFTPEKLEVEVQKKVLQRKKDIGRFTGARFDKNQGYRLTFYLREHQLFPKAFETKIEDHQATLIVRKLLRHFGKKYAAKSLRVRFRGNKQSGAVGWGIRLSHNPSIGLICHEVAHIFHRRHDKKLMRVMGRMIAYCEKKGYAS